MFDAGSHEQRVARGKFGTFARDDEFARSGNHEINLVSRVRYLRIVIDRRINLDDERPVRKRLGETLAMRPFFTGRAGQAREEIGYGCFHGCVVEIFPSIG